MSVEIRVSATGIKTTVMSCDFCGYSFSRRGVTALQIRRHVAQRTTKGRGRDWPVMGGWIKDYALRTTADFCRDYCVQRVVAKSELLARQRAQHRS